MSSWAAPMSDAEALEWLDRLLGLEEDGRVALLQQLSADNARLHARLVRLLAAALTVGSSRMLAQAVEQGVLGTTPVPLPTVFRRDQTLAGYRLLRELGRGGMASVWLAERDDGLIKRQIAVKLPLFSVASPVAAARFTQEKDVLAGLTHPHIARLYDAGIAEGQPFIVLEYVDGVPITQYCDSHKLGIPSRLRLFLQVLEAVDHAHKRLVVHRDLKPSNILVDSQGQVKLLDFGISKLLVDPSAPSQAIVLTKFGDAVFTPAYASPEQAGGGEISTLADIFVLGVVLHELLSGVLPYANACGTSPTLASMLDALLRGSPTRPSEAPIDDTVARLRDAASAARLRSFLKGDLDTITHKALQFEPTQRYGSAESFADDLRRYLCNRPIAARPPGTMYSIRLFLQRNRAAGIAAGIGTLLSLMGGVTAVQQYFDARASAVRAAAVRDFMVDFVNDAEQDESRTASQVTGREMLDGAVVRARDKFGAQPALKGELLGELGRMYVRFDEPALASELMVEAINLLEKASGADNSALNKTRAQLSSILVRQNKVSEARTVALLARDTCVRRTVDCAKARYVANLVLNDVYRAEGHTELSLRAMRNAVEDSVAAFGKQDSEFTEALAKLALVLRNSGQLVEAGDMIRRALDRSMGQKLREIERIRLGRTMALIELDLGHYDSAIGRLNELLNQTENRAERALQFRLLAMSKLAKGEPAAALRAADTALGLVEPEYGGVEPLYARQVRAQALALLNQPEQAADEIQAVIDGLSGVYSAQSLEVMRAHRIRAEILLRSVHPAGALRLLQSLRGQLVTLAGTRTLELGQTLDLLGCAQRELRLTAQSLASHQAAATQLNKILPTDHPFLLRNTLYRAAAAGNARQFAEQAKQIELGLAPTSIWRQVIEAQVHRDACRVTPTVVCTLVL